MKTSTKLLLLAGAAGLLAACASGPREVPPLTAGNVDLQRYQGHWYEVARLPMFFQRKCAQSEASYHVMADGSVAVFNRCRTLDGKVQEATGTATPIKPGVTDRLCRRRLQDRPGRQSGSQVPLVAGAQARHFRGAE